MEKKWNILSWIPIQLYNIHQSTKLLRCVSAVSPFWCPYLGCKDTMSWQNHHVQAETHLPKLSKISLCQHSYNKMCFWIIMPLWTLGQCQHLKLMTMISSESAWSNDHAYQILYLHENWIFFFTKSYSLWHM